MFEIRAGHRLVALAALSAIATSSAEAQGDEIREVRQQLTRMADSVSATNERAKQARRNATDQPDGSFIERGVRVTYPTSSVTEANLHRVRRAIRGTHHSLTRDYGAVGAALLEGDEWQIRTSTMGSRRPTARITLGTNAISVLTEFPFATRNVIDAAHRRASGRAASWHPAIERFAGGAPILSEPRAQYYVAHRQLVGGRSGPTRRCAAGNLSACDGLLSNDPKRWHDGEPPSGRLEPVTRAVHGSVVAYAIELKGAVVLEALRTGGAADAEPVAVLAQMVGLTRDAFLAQWYERLLEESRRHAAPSLPLSVTSLAWCGLILVIVGRRRPR